MALLPEPGPSRSRLPLRRALSWTGRIRHGSRAPIRQHAPDCASRSGPCPLRCCPGNLLRLPVLVLLGAGCRRSAKGSLAYCASGHRILRDLGSYLF